MLIVLFLFLLSLLIFKNVLEQYFIEDCVRFKTMGEEPKFEIQITQYELNNQKITVFTTNFEIMLIAHIEHWTPHIRHKNYSFFFFAKSQGDISQKTKTKQWKKKIIKLKGKTHRATDCYRISYIVWHTQMRSLIHTHKHSNIHTVCGVASAPNR